MITYDFRTERSKIYNSITENTAIPTIPAEVTENSVDKLVIIDSTTNIHL